MVHTERDPLKPLREKWLGDSKPQNFFDYVCNFRFKLHRACELAKQNTSIVQTKMKRRKKAEASVREIKCCVPGSTLRVRYRGLYLVQEKVND